jgi:5-carboxymethyl-2-hydroxymuconate isomerase
MAEEIKLNLNDQKVLEAMEWYAKEAVLFGDSEAAYRIVRLLPMYIAKTSVERPDFQMAYEKIILKARFIALDRLRDEEIVELLQNNFSRLFDISLYDLWEKVRAKLVVYPDYEKRDELRKKIRESILVSEQILTSEGLVLDGKKVKGTVKNWLIDYKRAVGAGKIEALKMSEYLINSPNTKSLSAESRQKLDYLLKFYEKTKLSSLDYEGIEEPIIFNIDEKVVIFKDGQVEKPSREVREWAAGAATAEKVMEIKGSLEEKYRGKPAEIKKVEEKTAQILKSTSGNFKKLSDLLFDIINPPAGRTVDKIRAEAILKILAEQGKLEDLLEEKRFNDMMVVYFKEKGRAVELDGFKLNQRGPQYVSAFLQYILKERVGLSEDESGRLGIQLFGVLAKNGMDSKYRGLVYFDLEKNEFRWA